MDKGVEELIKKLMKDVALIKKEVKATNVNLTTTTELLHVISAKVSDLSCKVDIDISTLNITKTKAPAAEKKLNIRTFFLSRYPENPALFRHIVSEEDEKDALEGENCTITNGSVVYTRPIVTAIYKRFIQYNDDKKELVKTLLNTENEARYTQSIHELVELDG